MSDVVIQVELLSKSYQYGTISHGTLHKDLQSWWARRRGKEDPNTIVTDTHRPGQSGERFWALQDISFDVHQGEIVGIIGRNGVGKSTLLKILSEITTPTKGSVKLKGRVGSLLEVGTGFHPELTGRENIYLNGAILGMNKAEIAKKFDEIVDFSGVEEFIDTPVKRYSSGMYVRLAFAIAAHLESEILLVDEVLAVGDVAFQKKCLGKMGTVAKGGRTVLFVSHQMNSIRKLCKRCVWLHDGHIQMIDSTVKVVNAYEMALTETLSNKVKRTKNANIPARFLSWEILEPRAEQPNFLTTLECVTFKIVVLVNKPVPKGHHGIALRNSDNQLMWAWATENLIIAPGLWEFVYTLPGLPLRPGAYSWHVSLYDEENLLDEWHCLPQLIIATEPLTHPSDTWSGILNIPCHFLSHRRDRTEEYP